MASKKSTLHSSGSKVITLNDLKNQYQEQENSRLRLNTIKDNRESRKKSQSIII